MIATEPVDEHLKILKIVFDRLVSNKLELRIDKCQFMQSQVQYLGYTITKEGIQPNTRGIESVNNFPTPRNVKAVHNFLGLFSYFRRLIKGFSLIAQPLFSLIRKDVSFEFAEKENQSFEKLKEKLIEVPILAIYSPNDETELHCDASSLGFGAILFQKKDDGKLHPIFIFSKEQLIRNRGIIVLSSKL